MSSQALKGQKLYSNQILNCMDVLIYLAVVIFFVYCEWKIYEKAGKPGWAAIIPIYNVIVMLEIVGKPVWWIILLLIPGVNIVILIILLHGLSKSFGQGTGFTLGLLFLGFIFIPMMALKNDIKYVGPRG